MIWDTDACIRAPWFEHRFRSPKSTALKGEQSKRWRLSEFAINKLLDFCFSIFYQSERIEFVWELRTGFQLALHRKWQHASILCGIKSSEHWSLVRPRWSWQTTWRSRLHSLVHWSGERKRERRRRGKNKIEKIKKVSQQMCSSCELCLHFQKVPSSTAGNGMRCTDAASSRAALIDRSSDLRRACSQMLCRCNELFESSCRPFRHTAPSIHPTGRISTRIVTMMMSEYRWFYSSIWSWRLDRSTLDSRSCQNDVSMSCPCRWFSVPGNCKTSSLSKMWLFVAFCVCRDLDLKSFLMHRTDSKK